MSQCLTLQRNLIQVIRNLLCADEGQEDQNSDLQMSLFGSAEIPSHVLKLLNDLQCKLAISGTRRIILFISTLGNADME